MVLGRCVRIAEFCRPLLSVFNDVWAGSSWPRGGILSGNMLAELLTFAGLVPLAFTDMRVTLSDMITVSDASETGGGACASAGVTEAGRAMAAGKLADDPSSWGGTWGNPVTEPLALQR